MLFKKYENDILNREPYINKSVRFSDSEINSIWDKIYSENADLSDELHSHYNFEVQACVGGEYIIECENGIEIKMPENEVCIIPMGIFHSSKADNDIHQRLSLRFLIKPATEKYISDGCYNNLTTIFNNIHEPIHFNSYELTVLIKNINKELSNENNLQSSMSEIMLVRFFASLFEIIISEKSEKIYKSVENFDDDNSRAFKIEQFFFNNYSKQIVEEDLSRFLNLSVRQTTRELNALYGVNFREMLINIRMINAAKLLLQTDYSVNLIAERVGYASTPGFCTSFKKYFGVSPSKYKKDKLNIK